MRLLVTLTFGLAACVRSHLVECDDGRTCPVGTVCDLAHQGCVDPDQLAECAELPDFEACTAIENGRCFDGVCLSSGCGNGFVEPEELCDDGNTTSGDLCSSSCLSREVCGDGFADRQRSEVCDDGNDRSRDGCTAVCGAEDRIYLRFEVPPLRSGAAVAYDTTRNRLVVFGGAEDAQIPVGLRDTRVWNGEMWMDVTGLSSPPVRHSAAMAYDPVRQRLVLFGGGRFLPDVGYLNDTWEWNGVSWELVRTDHIPPGRSDHTMMWDGEGILLYGGSSFGASYSDLWRFDGHDWHPVPATNVPPAGSGATAYDADRDRVVLVSGDETWTFDGSTWTQLPPTPGTITFPSLTYDPVRRKVVLVGEEATGHGTWTLDGDTWTSITPSATPPGSGELAFDLVRRRVVQWGRLDGQHRSNELWELDPDVPTWRQVTPAALPPGRQNAHLVFDRAARHTLLFGGVNIGLPIGTYRDDTWAWDGRRWTALAPITSPPARAAALMTHDGVRTILFGGTAAAVPAYGDMWTWDGQTWTPLVVARPSARAEMAFAYDSDRRRVVMFGGRSETGALLAETWEWDGAAWTQRAPASSPPGRRLGAMAYDPIHKRTILFGGEDQDEAVVGDTWLWDGQTWSSFQGLGPEPRSGHQLVFDASRGRVLVAGGLSVFSPWEWDGQAWRAETTVREPAVVSESSAAYDEIRREIVWFGGRYIFSSTNTTSVGSYLGGVDEVCASGHDVDGDSAIGCDDSDCASGCASCGDGTCAPFETDRSCRQDCPAAGALCGDGYCSPGETCHVDC